MFWMRRVLRIFPLYYAVLIVGTVVTVGILGQKWIPELPYWIYFQNYTLAFDTAVMRWTAHFWSLAIEEQFYFVWPLVALINRRQLIPVILALIVITVGLRAGLTFKGDHLGILPKVVCERAGRRRPRHCQVRLSLHVHARRWALARRLRRSDPARGASSHRADSAPAPAPDFIGTACALVGLGHAGDRPQRLRPPHD